MLLMLEIIGLQGCGTLVTAGNPVEPPSHGDQYLGDKNLVFHIHKYPHSARNEVMLGGVMNESYCLRNPFYF